MMHEESNDQDQSYDDDDSRNYRQGRFQKQPQDRSSIFLNEIDNDHNDTYQDLENSDDDPEHMESRAEYDSEGDEPESNFRRESRIQTPVSFVNYSIN